LGTLKPGPATNILCVPHLADTIKSRRMVILISESARRHDKLIQALRHFQHKKHDVIVFTSSTTANWNCPSKSWRTSAMWRHLPGWRSIGGVP